MASASGISLSQFLTLLNATRDYFIPDKLTMTLTYPRYEVINDILRNRKKTATGERYTTNIQLENATNGGAVGMFFVQDVSNIYDTDQKIISEWKHYTNNVSYDLAQIDINRGDKIKEYDYIKSQKMAMYRKTADDIQEQWWSAPATSSDATSIFGPPCWLTKGTDNSTGGFTGTSGYYLDGNTFDCGGKSASTYPKWASYYADHNGNLNETLLDMMGDANRATDFEAPLIPAGTVSGVETAVPKKVVYYTTNNVIKQVEKIARNSDDRIGFDLGKYAGETLYKGIPFRYVKQLDTASTYLWGTDPIYAINFDVLYPVVLQNWYFRTDEGKNAFAHNVVTEYVDLYWLVHCENRQGVGYLIDQQ
ncbi:MAG: hypothetical protein MUP81_03115 [Dehalococcoidia bacterium]|nr:hypothetical protein [Dehalococcoidia bacterium]